MCKQVEVIPVLVCRDHWPENDQTPINKQKKLITGYNRRTSGFYIKLNVWGSLGLNFEYDGGPIIEIGGPIFLYKLRIYEGSTSFREGSV